MSMQDFVPPEKRSIRNISIDRPQSLPSQDVPHTDTPPSADTLGVSLPPRYNGEKSSGWKRYALRGGIVVVGLLIIFFVISAIFSGATVTVVPKHTLASLDHSFSAFLTPEKEGDVRFEIVTLDRESSKEVTATGEERIEKASSGTITVFNTSTEVPLKLIKNTRFETPEGLVFRTPTSINVPGPKKDAQGKLVPGSIDVEVFADVVGEKYNIGLTDFVLPAFREKNDPLFSKVYARSKTAMAGGFSGVVKTASKADTDAAIAELKTQLTDTLTQSVIAAVPEGFIAVPETVALSFQNLPNQDGASGTSVSVRMKGTAQIVAIHEGSLAGQVARAFVTDYNGTPVRFEDLSAITIATTASSTSATSLTEIGLKVSGITDLVWQYDAEALAADLAGKKRRMTDAIFATYPGIERADISIRPFWKRTLPASTENIEIVTGAEE